MENEIVRIESREEVSTYLARLKYAIQNGGHLTFQIDRISEKDRPLQYTNRYTVADLFPDENPAEALKRELLTLSVREYISTNKDLRFPKRSEMRVFGKVYNGSDDVYVKIRVEIVGTDGQAPVFVMSFHYAMQAFKNEDFPYRD